MALRGAPTCVFGGSSRCIRAAWALCNRHQHGLLSFSLAPSAHARLIPVPALRIEGTTSKRRTRRVQDLGESHSWCDTGSRIGGLPVGMGEGVRARVGQVNLSSDSHMGDGSAPSSPSLKARLASGDKLYGAFLLSFSPTVTEIMGWAGYDFVVVDMEHGAGDTFAALSVLRALASTGTPAILRLPDNDPVLVKKALDVGPAGLMFPMIENGEAARNAVAACRYPPRGIRGAAHPIVRASRYGLDPSYLDRCEEDLFIMCQVETAEAVGHIPEIAEVEGVDCIQMGPLDMRASLGLLRSPGHPKADELLRRAEEIVLSCERKVFMAGFSTPQDSSEFLFQQGYHLVSGSTDVGLLRDAAVADLKRSKPLPKA